MSRIAILTRPAGRNAELARQLGRRGWQALDLPALQIEPLPISERDLPRPQDYDLVVFVSSAAAGRYLEQRAQAGQASWPAATIAATVGPASAAALRASPAFGADARLVHPPPQAPRHDSEALWAELERCALRPRRVLLVRATQGRDWLAERLSAAGASVSRHEAYRRSPACWSAEDACRLRSWQAAGCHPAWLLTSGEGIEAVSASIRRLELQAWWAQCRFVVTHPRLAERLAACLSGSSKPVVQICTPEEAAIVQAFAAFGD